MSAHQREGHESALMANAEDFVKQAASRRVGGAVPFGWRAGAALLVAAAVLAGCSSSSKPKPMALEPLTPQIAGKQVWSVQKLDGGVSFPLAVTARAGRFFVAGDDGVVLALDGATGREVWRGQVGAKLSAGVGSDGRFASVVTLGNELVTLEAGNVLWRAKLDSSVVTAPLVAGERVFVVGVDRVVHAFDALDGRRLWTLRRPGDALTLSQTGALAAYKDTLVVGQGPRLLGVDPTRGTVRWEAAVTTPRGTNEVERLADLVGPMSRLNNQFCVRAFQNAVGCVDADRGVTQWNNNSGGRQAVGGDAEHLYSADASDRITARRRTNGETVWTNEKLLNRELSAPVAIGKTVVFGDLEGQLHFLARDTGLPQLRLSTDGSPIVTAPVLVDNTLLVVTSKGGLFAFRPE